MKPFNLKKALAGHPLVTRDGREAKNFKPAPSKGRYFCDHRGKTEFIHYPDGSCPGVPEGQLFLDTPSKPRPKSETRKNVERVRAIMGRKWIQLEAIGIGLWTKYKVDLPEQSISARVRDLRKDEFGAYDICKKRIGKGLYAYRNFGKKGVVK